MPRAQSIVVHCTGDQPDLVALHELNPKRYPFLLQSVAHTTQQLHFDILFAFPQETLVLKNDNKLSLFSSDGDEVALNTDQDFLSAFDNRWRTQRTGDGYLASEVPFRGGWFLYLGYELAQQIEPSLDLPKDNNSDFPVAFATQIPNAIIINRSSGEWFMVAEHTYADHLAFIEKDVELLAQAEPLNHIDPLESTIKTIHEEPDETYLSNVRRIKDYITEGDVFQVNLSRLWNAQLRFNLSNAGLYRRLTQTNPAPFSALAIYKQHAIISSSPERLVRVSGDQVETRPIAGTRPRGSTQVLDAANLQELIGHPKERAEHIMLIDLERNDLGRVCKPGTVKVSELMTLETYAHVHHIVSNVQGTLREDCTPGEVIRAVFPGGTITGCPKVRCMEIIAELEGTPRGVYTGSLGYVNHDGSMDLNILIRTLVKNGKKVTLRAGAGIVADSDPQKELEETRAKAKGLLLAL
ncbi:aminodeoxychorismate synthase component I [Kaarinaea lacus]